MSESFEEIRFLLKVLKFSGNLPLKKIDSYHLKEIQFKWISLETFYCSLVYAGIIMQFRTIFKKMSIVQNIYSSMLFLCWVAVLYGCLKIKCLLSHIEEFDNGVSTLRGKQPFLKYQRKRYIVVVTIAILILGTNMIINYYGYGHLEAVIFLMFLNTPYLLYVILYLSISTAIIMRQKYLRSECCLLFFQIRTMTYKGPNPIVLLMKLRHLHLLLVRCIKTFEKNFSLTNMMNAACIYALGIYSFGYSQVVELKYVELPSEMSLLPYYVLCGRVAVCYFGFYYTNEQLKFEVSSYRFVKLFFYRHKKGKVSTLFL